MEIDLTIGLLVFCYIWGLIILKIILNRMNCENSKIFELLFGSLFTLIGVIPTILIRFSIIEKTTLSVLIAIAYFFSFVVISSFVLIKKASNYEHDSR